MTQTYAIPGVYYEPRPRVGPRALARTDVAGFLGFESRVRDGSTPSQLTGDPPSGHAFRVDVSSFQLPRGLLGIGRPRVPQTTGLVLSGSPTTIPIAPGGSITYAIVSTLDGAAAARLVVVAGPAAPTEDSGAPSDQKLTAAVGSSIWCRIANVAIRRSIDGKSVLPSIIPTLPVARCDDWSDFMLQFGGLPSPDDGTFLARGVRSYFGNGGARCYIATVRRPRFDDPEGLRLALDDLVGIAGASEVEATGLERLLRTFEVAVVDAPDLYTRRVDPDPVVLEIPPTDRDACFRDCDLTVATRSSTKYLGAGTAGAAVFDDPDVLSAQKRMIVRCVPERWRVQLLLTAPVAIDSGDGSFKGPDAERSIAWRQALDGAADDLGRSVAAFYHPWALTQEQFGAPVIEMPPTSLAAGIIARRDIARGPHISPANERAIGVVGLGQPVDDEINARIYEPPMNINPLRAFAGRGVQVWGSRTLSHDRWMRYLAVRRCLSAIERKAYVALRPFVFEPITPVLWLQVTRAMFDILLPIFNAGALRGETAEQAFFVRCDQTNNPSETIAEGQVLCEVGVAIAAPAEFIVFRVGRREALVEILESP